MSVKQSEWPLRYLEDGADLGDVAVVERYFADLQLRNLSTPAALDEWLLHWAELDAWLDEEGSVRYVDMTSHTDDERIEKRYLGFIELIVPLARARSNSLDRKLLECPHRSGLSPDRFGTFVRRVENRVRLFREENIPLKTQDEKLRQQYQKLVGGLTVQFEGREQTLQQMALYLERTDRAVRQQAWELVAAKWLLVQEDIESLYDRMVAVRHRMAVNADLPDYRAYAFRELERFDYTAEDCTAFAESIAKRLVPAARELGARRKALLGVDRLRPWDMAVDPRGREPLTPFTTSGELLDGCERIFGSVDAALGAQFSRMRAAGLLDLESRKGKAPGGYMMDFKGRRVPFIFMNAVGTHDDVQTLLHEGGHAFHAFAARDEDITFLRDAPIEFAEVASMGMEMIAGAHLDVFYEPPDAARAWQEHLEGVLCFFPYMATIDQLQHWAYTHPDHRREERRAHWQALNRRFADWVDFSGHEDALAFAWHRKGHPFTVPFYYVEYGIAQLGALGVWMNSLADRDGAIGAYRRGLALGGRKPLPELFAAAGVRFDFSEGTIAPAVAAVEAVLNAAEKSS